MKKFNVLYMKYVKKIRLSPWMSAGNNKYANTRIHTSFINVFAYFFKLCIDTKQNYLKKITLKHNVFTICWCSHCNAHNFLHKLCFTGIFLNIGSGFLNWMVFCYAVLNDYFPIIVASNYWKTMTNHVLNDFIYSSKCMIDAFQQSIKENYLLLYCHEIICHLILWSGSHMSIVCLFNLTYCWWWRDIHKFTFCW